MTMGEGDQIKGRGVTSDRLLCDAELTVACRVRTTQSGRTRPVALRR